MVLVVLKERKPQTTKSEVTFFFFKCSTLGLAFYKGTMADSIFNDHLQKFHVFDTPCVH